MIVNTRHGYFFLYKRLRYGYIIEDLDPIHAYRNNHEYFDNWAELKDDMRGQLEEYIVKDELEEYIYEFKNKTEAVKYIDRVRLGLELNR